MLWVVAGYFFVIVGGLTMPYGLIEYYRGKPDSNPITTFLGSVMFLGIGIFMFSNAPIYRYDSDAATAITGLMALIILGSVVLGVIVSVVKRSRAGGGSLGQRILVATVAGVLSSIIVASLGVGEGLNIFSVSIGGLVFFTVSLFNS